MFLYADEVIMSRLRVRHFCWLFLVVLYVSYFPSDQDRTETMSCIVDVSPESDFSLENLPYGVFSTAEDVSDVFVAHSTTCETKCCP